MKDMGIVQGSAKQAVPIVVGTDTVYVHTNIVQVTEDQDGNPTDNLYTYHEVQYEKDEYIRMMAEQTDENNRLMAALLGGWKNNG